MTRLFPLGFMASLTLCFVLGGAGAAGAQMTIENRDLLSPTERDIYHEQMGNAGGRDEREGYRTGHSDTVRERASTRGTDMSQTGRGMRDGDHGHSADRSHTSADSGITGDGGAHGNGVGGSGSGHRYGPKGDSAGARAGGQGGGSGHGKGKKSR